MTGRRLGHAVELFFPAPLREPRTSAVKAVRPPVRGPWPFGFAVARASVGIESEDGAIPQSRHGLAGGQAGEWVGAVMTLPSALTGLTDTVTSLRLPAEAIQQRVRQIHLAVLANSPYVRSRTSPRFIRGISSFCSALMTSGSLPASAGAHWTAEPFASSGRRA